MSRILFAWELGGGYGHLGPFRPVAVELMSRGHHVTVAAREVERGDLVFGATGAQLVQAPLCMKNYGGLEEPPLNFSEILMRYGYLDAPMLGGLTRAWRDLMQMAQPDALIADHAPTALLAARGLRMAKLVTGAPFTIPSRAVPTPNMRSWVAVPRERLESSDASVLRTINACIGDGMPRLESVPGIFDGADFLVGGLPELDPNGPRPADAYLGLYSGVFGTAVPQWPAGDGPRVFAYLNTEYQHLEAVIAALAASDARCIAVVVGNSAALKEKYQARNLSFSTGMLDLAQTLRESDLCVCHGNFGTVNEALRYGTPQMILPMDLEKFLTASALLKLNVACFVNPDAPAPDFAGALRRVLSDALIREAARAFAERHREPSVDRIVRRAADRIEALAQGGGAR